MSLAVVKLTSLVQVPLMSDSPQMPGRDSTLAAEKPSSSQLFWDRTTCGATSSAQQRMANVALVSSKGTQRKTGLIKLRLGTINNPAWPASVVQGEPDTLSTKSKLQPVVIMPR